MEYAVLRRTGLRVSRGGFGGGGIGQVWGPTSEEAVKATKIIKRMAYLLPRTKKGVTAKGATPYLLLS